MKKQHIIALTIATAHASEHKLEITIPQIDASEYHKPYVSVWIQSPTNDKVKNILVWYQMKKDSAEGQKWLKDMRKWWRTSGRKLDIPVDGIDGITSPTRPPGKHRIDITAALNELPALTEGEYTLCVEAAREVGGRELIKITFKWDGKSLTEVSEVKGKSELGEITLKSTTNN